MGLPLALLGRLAAESRVLNNMDAPGILDDLGLALREGAAELASGDSPACSESTGDFSVFPASDMSESELPQWLEGPEALFCGDSKASPEGLAKGLR